MFLFAKQGKLAEEVADIRRNISAGFHIVKEELDTHLETINQNTSEIESAYDFLIELDKKMEKITERLDQIELQLSPINKFGTIVLSHQEQETFMVLHNASDRLSLKDLAKRTGLTDDLADTCVCSMIAKKVPIIRELDGENCWLLLEPAFKALQAKQGVIHVNEQLSHG